MRSHQKTACIVGILFIIATLFFVVGQMFNGPILDIPEYLERAHPQRAKVMTGVLLELIAVFAIILIPVFMYPVLKKDNEALALGYAGFRLLEAGFLTIGIAGMLAVVDISQSYLAAEDPVRDHFEAVGTGIQSFRDWSFTISVSFLFTVGTLIFNYLLYKARLIPRFISTWGVVGAAFLLAGSVLILYNVFAGVRSEWLASLFFMPIAVQEMVLAVWLLARGFAQNGISGHRLSSDK
jgi:hypothetical protein